MKASQDTDEVSSGKGKGRGKGHGKGRGRGRGGKAKKSNIAKKGKEQETDNLEDEQEHEMPEPEAEDPEIEVEEPKVEKTKKRARKPASKPSASGASCEPFKVAKPKAKSNPAANPKGKRQSGVETGAKKVIKPQKTSKVSKAKGGEEPEPSDPADLDCPAGGPKTFARRYRPKGGMAARKWDAMKNAFNHYIRPCVRKTSAHEDRVACDMLFQFKLLLCSHSFPHVDVG